MAAVLNAERLEVSVDGLTLSPDPEERPGAEGAPLLPSPLPSPSSPGSGRGSGTAGEQPVPGEAEEEARRLEQLWGFGLEELYGLALRFFKEKDGKAFHPTYEEKLKLVALHKQVLMGPYNPDTCPEVGFFDVLGNDRRKEWAALGSMSKEDAMVQFVKLLNRCCHLFSTYVTSHKIEKEEQEKKRKEEEERRRREEEERERLLKEEEMRRREEEERLKREEEERRRAEEERLRLEQQKQQIMAALNSQTAVQFQQYAAQQYPGNYEQQQILIRQLQEQHYQQYMQQLYQVQLAQQQAALQKQQDVTVAGASLPTSSKVNAVVTSDKVSVNGQAKTHTDNCEKELEPEAAEEVLENGPKENITCEEKAKKNANKPLLDEIVPVYRRDCHEEVYAGSHQYPGRGVYLLKFDNSYSLWRSKSVYYRVYYTR
ncbi:Golgi resident protein GCP60 isoform X3 [Cavia porcellus]|uniref:Golgi resident protein GCP60 isoform X3 n=1 Tax=Cavia porcellus TaxID=10141 RepID=UPI000661D0D3|nr:Golgi resident protein GCP60 isoform X2 [Cavia porcellus]